MKKMIGANNSMIDEGRIELDEFRLYDYQTDMFYEYEDDPSQFDVDLDYCEEPDDVTIQDVLYHTYGLQEGVDYTLSDDNTIMIEDKEEPAWDEVIADLV